MNEAKMARMEGGLNGIAKKVLAAVPIQETWTKDQIAVELRRQGYGADRKVLDGCLDTLRGRGLVTEPVRGSFTRVTAKQKTNQPEIKIVHSISTKPKESMSTIQTNPQHHETQMIEHLPRLAAIAKGLRQTADELESIALEVEERIQTAEKDTANLRQLQTLLKSIGG